MNLQMGGNAPLSGAIATIALSYGRTPPGDVDLSAYLLRADGRTRDDQDMVFYGAPSAFDGAVTIDQKTRTLRIDTSRLPDEIERIPFCLVVENGSARDLGSIEMNAGDATFRLDCAGSNNAAVVVTELYRRAGAWKIRAVGQGFDGGLGPLARSYGIDVADEAAPANGTADPVRPTAAEILATPTPVNLSKVDLRKHKVGISLAKKGLTEVEADVTLVIDASGSMHWLYENDTVQDTVERMVPVALRLDKDGKLDTWFYATSCAQVDALDEASMGGFVRRTLPTPNAPVHDIRAGGILRRRKSIGYGNEEHVVMTAILEENGRRDASRRPLLVLFVTDGGIGRSTSDKIVRILREHSDKPIFWQFIGLGNQDYGVLRMLDEISGRVVDNAGFFAVDDISRIDDDELYDRMLSEFPDWLRAAERAGIVPAGTTGR